MPRNPKARPKVEQTELPLKNEIRVERGARSSAKRKEVDDLYRGLEDDLEEAFDDAE